MLGCGPGYTRAPPCSPSTPCCSYRSRYGCSSGSRAAPTPGRDTCPPTTRVWRPSLHVSHMYPLWWTNQDCGPTLQTGAVDALNSELGGHWEHTWEVQTTENYSLSFLWWWFNGKIVKYFSNILVSVITSPTTHRHLTLIQSVQEIRPDTVF